MITIRFAGWISATIVGFQPDMDIQKLLSNVNRIWIRISEKLLSIFRGLRLLENLLIAQSFIHNFQKRLFSLLCHDSESVYGVISAPQSVACHDGTQRRTKPFTRFYSTKNTSTHQHLQRNTTTAWYETRNDLTSTCDTNDQAKQCNSTRHVINKRTNQCRRRQPLPSKTSHGCLDTVKSLDNSLWSLSRSRSPKFLNVSESERIQSISSRSRSGVGLKNSRLRTPLMCICCCRICHLRSQSGV